MSDTPINHFERIEDALNLMDYHGPDSHSDHEEQVQFRDAHRNAEASLAFVQRELAAAQARVRELEEGHDPDMLEAIATEICDYANSARVDSLRVLARKARALLNPKTEQP